MISSHKNKCSYADAQFQTGFPLPTKSTQKTSLQKRDTKLWGNLCCKHHVTFKDYTGKTLGSGYFVVICVNATLQGLIWAKKKKSVILGGFGLGINVREF